MNLLLAVVGPTASGKSELALSLAEELNGEIINCDSLQVYKHFDIGTAKPAPVERRGIAHHLMDMLEPTETLTAGEYARRARVVLEQVGLRGNVPILVGGTGFYLRALLEGLFPSPAADPRIRERLRRRTRQKPAGYLHRLLKRLDPVSAARIHANDAPKLIRAIEVCIRARRPMSALFEETRGQARLEGFRAVKIGLHPPRSELYEHINRRAERMFEGAPERGIVGEVRDLLARGVPRDAKPFESHGYQEALAVAEGRMSVAEAIESTQIRTRHYAKRQMTWFRREPELRWITGFGDDPEVQRAAAGFSILHS